LPQHLNIECHKERLIPPRLTKAQINMVYASEADLLNVALFGNTAAEWRKANSGQTGNMRDAATLEQLVVLSNLESINAVLIHHPYTHTTSILAQATLPNALETPAATRGLQEQTNLIDCLPPARTGGKSCRSGSPMAHK
jgi:hypothetical protein